MTLDLKVYSIIITGAGGIIGRALSVRLSQAGATVIGIDRCGAPDMIKTFQEAGQGGPINLVFHLAAQSDVNQCELNPALAIEQNTKLTASVLDACVKAKIPRLIFPSTAYVYGTSYQEKIKEDFALHPGGVYTLTKLWSEMLIQ